MSGTVKRRTGVVVDCFESLLRLADSVIGVNEVTVVLRDDRYLTLAL
jgi:hypothetical protein